MSHQYVWGISLTISAIAAWLWGSSETPASDVKNVVKVTAGRPDDYNRELGTHLNSEVQAPVWSREFQLKLHGIAQRAGAGANGRRSARPKAVSLKTFQEHDVEGRAASASEPLSKFQAESSRMHPARRPVQPKPPQRPSASR